MDDHDWWSAMPPFPDQPGADQEQAAVTDDVIAWVTMATARCWLEEGDLDDRASVWRWAAELALDEAQWEIISSDDETLIARHRASQRLIGGYWDDREDAWRWGRPMATEDDDEDIVIVPVSDGMPSLIAAWYARGVAAARAAMPSADDAIDLMPEERVRQLNRLFALQRACGEEAYHACDNVARDAGLWREEVTGDQRAFLVFDPRARQAALAWFDTIETGFGTNCEIEDVIAWVRAIGVLPEEDEEPAWDDAGD